MQFDIVTPQDLKAMEERLSQILTSQVKPEVLYLSINQVAQRTGFHPKTVRRWISEGKPGKDGKRIYLPIKIFTESEQRVLLSDLIEFANAS